MSGRHAARARGRTWLAVATVVAAVCWLRLDFVDSVRVGSDSMAPTYCHGDQLLVLRVGAASAGPGDVVVFTDPLEQARSLKRVVAVEDQVVRIYDAALLVDGVVREEPYVDPEPIEGTFFGPVTVGPGSVFVLGDEREFSVDSRDYGAIARSAIDGKVLTRLWSGC